MPLETITHNISTYFTNAEPTLAAFRRAIKEPTLTKRLMFIHGIAGIGKSSLLQMFRLYSKSAHVPVALALGEDVRSAVDVLKIWAQELKTDNIHLPTFTQKLKMHLELQKKVERRVYDTNAKTIGMAKQIPSKIGEAAGGAAGAFIGSFVPIAGPIIGTAIGGIVGNVSIETLVSWLQNFLTKPDIDLLFDPTNVLTDCFLNDVNSHASKRRIVLMLDTYEQITAMDSWMCDFAKHLHPNILLTIAGEEMVNWHKHWNVWLAHVENHRLEPMKQDVMRELVRRYYATQVGSEPDPVQVEKIIHFSRGLPIAVVTVVRLWVEYNENFEFKEVEADALNELTKWLCANVSPRMIPFLEAAAAVRYFNKEILRTIIAPLQINEVYEELRSFPFIMSSSEGTQRVLRLHSSMREFIDRRLQIEEPDRHSELHLRAAKYFEERLARPSMTNAESFILERLYHYMLADEETGLKIFQEYAEAFTHYRLISRLRTLMNDVNTFNLDTNNSRLWRDYYNTRLAHLERRYSDAEKMFQSIVENPSAETRLKAYALCDLGEILNRSERLGQPGGSDKAIAILEQAIQTTEMDEKLVFAYSHIKGVYVHLGEWQQAIYSIQRQLEFLQQKDNQYGIVEALGYLRGIYGLMGDWENAFKITKQALEILEVMPEKDFLKMRLTHEASWIFLWSGRYKEIEDPIKSGLDYALRADDIIRQIDFLNHLGHVLGHQNNFQEALQNFSESIRKTQQINGKYFGPVKGFLGFTLIRQGELDEAEKTLLEALSHKEEMADKLGIQEIFNWLGELHEIQLNWQKAEYYYEQSIKKHSFERNNLDCATLTGLIRVKFAKGDISSVAPLLAKAEVIAERYEYNNYLTSLRLTEAYISITQNNLINTDTFDYALQKFKQALVHAVRYNRFLLDEALGGRPQGSPLCPIIKCCLEQGTEGQRMLQTLHSWWQTGTNDAELQRINTISPISEGITLLDAERIARRREPGDGTPQVPVLAQLEHIMG